MDEKCLDFSAAVRTSAFNHLHSVRILWPDVTANVPVKNNVIRCCNMH